MKTRGPLVALARWLAALPIALLVAGGAASEAPAAPSEPPELVARAWALIDARDGTLLAGRRERVSYPVASTTKLMTAYVARRALRPGERVVAPGYAPSSSAESLLGLVEGERITTRDLLYGLLLASGNDAAEALAIASAGSIEAFVGRMNRAARRLGLDDTSYANPVGLDEPGNFSSAADLVELARELRRDPLFDRIFDSPAATLTSGAETRTVVNRNNLVRTVPYVDGVKTGFTLGAGNVLVGSASRDGVAVIGAVLGEPTESERDAEMLELLEYGFSLYRSESPVKRGEVLGAVPVRFRDDELTLEAARTIEITARRDQRVRTEVVTPTEVDGPIRRGERIGRAVVEVDGRKVAATALLATRGVDAATIADRIDAGLPGPRAAAWVLVTAVLALGLIALVRVLMRRR